jgi:hypothetical protein
VGIDFGARRAELYGLMGELPDRGRKIGVKVVSVEERGNFVLEKLLLDLNGIELVPACFSRPIGAKGKVGAVLYHHAHGGNYELGKEELLIGRPALQKPAYAELLAGMGLAGLCIDTWAFGERRGRTEGEIFKEMLWRGQVMWGMMVYDNLRALDYLCARPEVDASRIATGGISMGSTMAWWVAALDERIKATFDICCLTDFETLIETRGLDGHGIYYYVPRLLKHFSSAQINELIGPRAHLSLAGNYDKLTPPAGLEKIDRHLKKAYGEMGAAEKWELVRYDCGHFETADMRARIVEFLKREIGG